MHTEFEKTFLAHHGILGQKWGVRRYQNSDGTLTAAGKKRYGKMVEKANYKRFKDIREKGFRDASVGKNKRALEYEIFNKELSNTKEYKEYAPLRDKLAEYEHSGEYTESKYNALRKAHDKALDKYDKKIDQVYGKHENELLEARLKDLKLPTDSTMREFYKEYNKTRVSSLDKYYPDDPYHYLRSLGV